MELAYNYRHISPPGLRINTSKKFPAKSYLKQNLRYDNNSWTSHARETNPIPINLMGYAIGDDRCKKSTWLVFASLLCEQLTTVMAAEVGKWLGGVTKDVFGECSGSSKNLWEI